MADSVVTFLLEKLTNLLGQEVKLLSGVKDEITSLRNELKFINVFLKNSEGKRNEHEIVAEVVNQIRDVTHEAEDVVDTYIANIIKQRRRNLVERIVYGKDHVKMLHDVAGKIEKIKGTIKEIYNNKIKYDIKEGESTRGDTKAAESLRKRRRVVEEEEVVGFVHDSSVVIKKLMETGSRLNVVSIIGMGGLGKTTLARKIYKNNRVKKLFLCRAWGYVSNDYRPKEFLLSLLQCLLSTSKYNDLFKRKENEVVDEGQTISEEELKKKVRKCLNRKKFLVVLDDIWNTQVWDEVKGAFPDDNNGSRILITSRTKEVASYTSQTTPYNLPFLNKEESWELLSKKVFRGEECPLDLEPLGRLIAESCGGLPLAIVVLAGLLANKKSQREWSRIKGHVNWHLGRDKTRVSDVLKLSYNSLPRRLKPCFLYCGVYPEDYEIPVRQLIQLWIAEGLIQETGYGTRNPPEPEDVAEDYLDDLVDRSLVQVASRRTDGGVKTCRIHDLLRDLCISESKDDNFFEVCTVINILTQNSPRRLSLCGTLFHFSSSSTTCDHYLESGTRSLLCFGQEVYKVKSSHWKWLLKSFRLARVLDLGRMNINSIPSDLEKLIHLRYLRIHSYGLQTIPASIGSLWNLETLDVRGSPIKTFSNGMWQLKRLRHLYMFGPVKLPTLSGSDSKIMPNLQTLSTVALGPQTMSLVDMGGFPNLRKLGLYYEQHHKCKPRELLQSLHRLTNLHTLKIIGTSELPSVANAFPSNVTKITLKKFGCFNFRGMNTLARLTNLQILKLSAEKDHNNFNFHCAVGGFLKLRVFQMVGMNVKRWRLDNGSMPRLRRLVIKSCKSLTELPKELWSLTALREVQVLWPSTELANRLQNLEVKNGCKLIIYPLPTNEE